MAAKGEWITFFDKDTTVSVTNNANTTIELPTGDACVWDTGGAGTDMWLYDCSSFAADKNISGQNQILKLGTITYNISGTPAANTVAISVASDTAGTEIAYPGAIVLEENDKDSTKNAVIIGVNKDGSNYMTINTPIFTESTASLVTWESDSSISSGGDSYGTFVVFDSDNQGKADIYYPDDQAIAAVGVGSDPSFSTGTATAGGKYNEAVPVTNPVAKLASEIPQDSTLNQDLILVGGPCANPIVETLLAKDWNVTSACDYWLGGTDADLAAGNGLIKVVEDVFESGQKALIVAGTNAEDTRALIGNYVIKPTKMATLTGGEYKGSVA